MNGAGGFAALAHQMTPDCLINSGGSCAVVQDEFSESLAWMLRPCACGTDLVGPLLMHENYPEGLREVDRILTFASGIAKER